MQRTGTSLLRAFGSVVGCGVGAMLFAQQPFVLNDTTFLQRDTLGGEYHAVFLLPAGRAAVPPSEGLFSLSPESEAHVGDQVRELRGSLAVECPAERPPLHEQWVPVFRSGDRLCTYSPCDNMNARAVWLRAGYAVEAAEGPEVSLVRTLGPTEGACSMVWYSAVDPTGMAICVRPIDPVTGVALWTIGEERPFFRLMVPAENANLLPRVVNHCPARKWMEFRFDPIDPNDPTAP